LPGAVFHNAVNLKKKKEPFYNICGREHIQIIFIAPLPNWISFFISQPFGKPKIKSFGMITAHKLYICAVMSKPRGKIICSQN
jgi:hypothetical protein